MSNRLTFSLASLILLVAGFGLLIPSTAYAQTEADPTFGDDTTQDPIELVVDATMTPIILPAATDADAGDVITYVLTNPAESTGVTLTNASNGILFDPVTRELTGTPWAITAIGAADADVTWTLTATSTKPDASSGGTAATLTFTLRVTTDITFESAPSMYVFKKDQSIDRINLPTATDASGDTVTYALYTADGTTAVANGALTGVTGLDYNDSVRFIDGTPTAVTSSATNPSGTIKFIYRASFTETGPPARNSGTASYEFTIVVSEPTAPAFPAGSDISDISATVGTGITPVQLPIATDPDGDAVTHSIDPALPAGLSIQSGTQILHGTPTAAQATTTEYTWTATAGGETAELTFNITVTGPPAAPAAPTAAINSANDLIIDVTWAAPAPNGSTITGYTVKKYDSSDTEVGMFSAGASATTLAVGPVMESDRGNSYTFTVTAKSNLGDGAESPASSSVTVPAADRIAGEITIPGGGYVVVARSAAAMYNHLSSNTLYVGAFPVQHDPINIQAWPTMPDLATLFRRSAPGKGGGALVVMKSTGHTGNIGVGTVGISEIMWAWDEGAIFGQTRNRDHTREQWIELHNTNSTEVKVMLKAYNATDNTPEALKPQSGEIDRMSNYNISSEGGAWDVKGQSGNSALGKDFVSMWRQKTGATYKFTHNDQDNNGRRANRWNASEYVYLREPVPNEYAASPLVEKLVFEWKGTPGRSNTISPTGAPTRTNVPNSPVIFNEVANLRNTDQKFEWIELKNVSGGEVNLRNYHISFVDGVNSEKPLYTFPNNDNTKIPANGILLLVASDPRYNDDHPVAVGYNIHGGNDQALGIGADAPRYMDMSRVSDANRGYENGLPDSGDFVLMLRRPDGHDKHNTARNKMATDKNMVDAVGRHTGLGSTGPPLYTNLWPLKVFGTANKGHSKMDVDTVHYRRVRNDPDQGNGNADQTALNGAGYTGVGYKRFANRHNPAHGGTPGYDHAGLIQHETPHIGGAGVVTISEIMFDQGDGRYPQWIELYNSSDKPVNLHAGDHGWRLVVENFDDGVIPINRLTGTLNFRSSDVQTILPKQTVLVTSTRARSSGSAYFDTSVIFPPTRVFSVWDDARGALAMESRTDPILSTEGFYIELLDGKNRVSDSVGNLVDSPNRRVAAQKAWELSEITGEMMEGEARSSIMRRYRKPSGGTFRDPVTNEVNWPMYTPAELKDTGITVEGWVLASMTDFRDVSETWYGDRGDVGSPGITTGRVLPVELSTFRPVRLDNGSVSIRWITESEKDNAGFNILRSDKRYGEFTKLNTQLIAGQGTTSERTAYEFVDKTAKPNVVYYYQIQDVSLDGDVQILKVTHLRGHVSAAGKATTTWGRLKALQ